MVVSQHVVETTQPKDRSRVHYRNFHNIFLYVTERCQLRCGHCYMGDRLERGLTLSLQRATEIITQCRRLGADYITFLGGEPTLHPGLSQMVDLACRLGYSQVMIDSNGLSIERIRLIPASQLHYITISLDGATAATHETVRGAGTFERTTETIAKLVQEGYPVRLNCTMFSFNLHEAQDILAFAERLGVRLVNFHTFSEEGYGSDKREWSLTKTEWVTFCDWLDGIRKRCPISVWYPPTWTTVAKLDQYAREGFRGCLGCSLDRLSIFPDGRCYVCSVLFDRATHFATISESGLVLNRGANEFELFTEAAFNASTSSRTGCPAETLLGTSEAPVDEGLVSVCRCWKSQGLE